MNNYLITEFQKLGADERNAVLSSQVYLELCEVKRYWDIEYEYSQSLQKIMIRAKRKPSEEHSVFMPIPSYEKLSFVKLKELLQNCSCNSLYLAIVHPDSTCVYYNISNDLVEPTDTTAKHLRVNKQDKLDAELRKHRSTIEQAALLGIPITIPKEKPHGSKDMQSEGSTSDLHSPNN